MKSFYQVDCNTRIMLFVKKLGEYINDVCKDQKKVCLQLSGGYDTRSILAVLLNYNIKFEVVTSNFSRTNELDKSIVEGICNKYNIKTWYHNYGKDDKFINGIVSLCEYTKDYDVVLSGLAFTEILNRFNRNARWCIKKFQDDTLIYTHLPMIYLVTQKYNNVVFPILDYELLNIIRYLPKFCLRDSYIQKKIIKYFHPSLFEFDFVLPDNSLKMEYGFL